MRFFAVLFIVLILKSVLAAQEVPLKDGTYTFEHKFAEAQQQSIKSIQLIVTIKAHHIVIINHDRYDVFPKGIIEEGELMWHAKSGQWIIANTPSDAQAEDVGGCSDGPTVIDLEHRIYWTC